MNFVIAGILAVLAIAGAAAFWWWNRQMKLFRKAAEYAGYNNAAFARGKTPPYDVLISAMQKYPERLALQGRHLAVRVRAVLDADATALENVQPSLAQFFEACDGGYVQSIHIQFAKEPADAASRLARRLPPHEQELKAALAIWAADVLTWISVVGESLDHWKAQLRAEQSNRR